MIEVVQPGVAEAGLWEDLTYPLYRPVLRGDVAGVALGARVLGQSIGLALAAPGRRAQLLSVAVVPNWRGRGVARRLLEAVELELARLGSVSIEATFIAGQPSTAALERLLAGSGWTAPEPRMLVCRAEIATLRQAAFVARPFPVGAGELFPWTSLTSTEREALLEEQQRVPFFPSALSPFDDLSRIEPANSLGLRHRGRILGWMVTHRVAPDLVRYSRLFVRRSVQAGTGLALVGQSIRQHAERLAGDAPHGSMDAAVGNRPMTNFVLRRLRPFLTSLSVSKGSRKALSAIAQPRELAEA